MTDLDRAVVIIACGLAFALGLTMGLLIRAAAVVFG